MANTSLHLRTNVAEGKSSNSTMLLMNGRSKSKNSQKDLTSSKGKKIKGDRKKLNESMNTTLPFMME